MKPGQIKITSDGTAQGTTVETYVGDKIKNVVALNISVNSNHRIAEAELKLYGPEIDIIANCTNIEDLARELHEAGRAAVEQGNTVAAEKFGEQTRKFIEWDELTEPAKDGRRTQAVYLLQKYYIKEK